MPEEVPPHIPLQPILEPAQAVVHHDGGGAGPDGPRPETGQEAAERHRQRPVTLLRWIAPSRLHEPKSPTWYLGLFAIGVIGIILFAVLRDLMLILLTAAFIFVYYALARVEPTEVEHRILNVGVDAGGRLYSWKDLKSYWIQADGPGRMLRLDTQMIFPPSLELLLPDEAEMPSRQFEQALDPYLPAVEKTRSESGQMTDNAIYSVANMVPKKEKLQAWLSSKLNLQ